MFSTLCPACDANCSLGISVCATCGYSFDKAADLPLKTEVQHPESEKRLRPCPDCGHNCSTAALACPSCGRPFPRIGNENGKTRKASLLPWLIGALLVVVVIAAAVTLYLRLRTQEGSLTGDIFIVTKGAQNFKLGLIEVSAIREEKMQQFILKKEEAVRVAIGQFEAQRVAAEKELATAQEEYDALKAAVDAAEAKSAKAEKELLYLYSEVEDPTNLIRQSEAASKQARDIKQKLFSKDLELMTIKSRIAKAEPSIANLGGVELLFTDLPPAEIKAITDAEGRFSMKLPTKGEFAIAARAQRNVIDSTEHYYWMIWVSLDGETSKQIILSNNNQLDSNSPDSVFNIKELLKRASMRQL